MSANMPVAVFSDSYISIGPDYIFNPRGLVGALAGD